LRNVNNVPLKQFYSVHSRITIISFKADVHENTRLRTPTVMYGSRSGKEKDGCLARF